MDAHVALPPQITARSHINVSLRTDQLIQRPELALQIAQHLENFLQLIVDRRLAPGLVRLLAGILAAHRVLAGLLERVLRPERVQVALGRIIILGGVLLPLLEALVLPLQHRLPLLLLPHHPLLSLVLSCRGRLGDVVRDVPDLQGAHLFLLILVPLTQVLLSLTPIEALFNAPLQVIAALLRGLRTSYLVHVQN